MFQDFIQNGRGHGPVGNALAECEYDTGLMRPYYDVLGDRYVPFVTVNTGRTEFDEEQQRYVPIREKIPVAELAANGMYSPVMNATTLRKDEWIELDRRVIMEARERLRAWNDLAASARFGGFDGMSRSTLEYETMSDPGEALVDMDALTEGRRDTPLFQLEAIPLPITHADFSYSERRLRISRNSGTPLDSRMAEVAARRVAETVEKTVIGTLSGITYGDQPSGAGNTSTVYGYTNFPDRSTKTDLTTPTGSNPDKTVDDVLAMIETATNNNFFGPYMLYYSTDWTKFMGDDYVTGTAGQGLAAPSKTLRTRLMEIEQISDVRRLDFLTNTFTLLLVQMTSDVARAVVGMDITTVQWESQGGMRKNFKVMGILVPQLFSTQSSVTGIVHGTTS